MIIVLLLLFGSGFGGGGGGGGALSIAIEIGLHTTSFRDALIDEDFIEGCWPLAELERSVIRDISGHEHHGTLVGTGFTKGIATGLPEGGLALRFNGNGYVLVPNASNLSLANGDVDLYGLINTSHNSATLRCIGAKQDTNSSGNGWHLALQSGAIVAFLRVSGSTIFSFSRGSVSDGAWHLIHLNYQTGPGEARIFIDGVQSGATVTGVTTEPGTTTAAMRIGMFTDGVAGDGSGFIGDIAYFSIGREGNQSLSATLQALRLWTDITGDTRSAVPMTIDYGINSSSPLDNTATSGICRVGLDNSEANSSGLLGLYSLDHANKRTGFRRGSPLRVIFTFNGTSYYKHVGRVMTSVASPGSRRERLTMVTSADWMDVAASSRLTAVPAQTNIDSDAVISLAIDEASRPPHAVEISDGVETFLHALDVGFGQRETVLSEAVRTATSERGFFYLKGDTIQGGVVTFESRADRQIDTTIAASFDNSMSGLEPDDSIKPNTVLVTVHPTVVGTVAVLFSMTERVPIPPGETVEILVEYRDPTQTSVIVGGSSMITPVATTDYTMNANSDGAGLDVTAFASIRETGAQLGGTATSIHVTNNTGAIGWFQTQLRGNPVRHENPVTTPVFEASAVRLEGASEITLDLPYITSPELSADVGRQVLALYEAGKIRSISFVANKSETLMTQALAREVGDRIGITEQMQSGVVEHAYVINHVSLTVETGGIITCTWTLAPAIDAGAVWILGSAGFSELGDTTVLGL